ncbi:MAG: 6-phosphogluconolactonase [Paracoccaceae bacterium]
MTDIISYTSRDEMAGTLAALLAEKLHALVQREHTARIALAGGSTPAPMLQALGAHDEVPWGHVTVTLTDERWVPVTDPRSNHRLLNETLLSGPAAATRVVPLYSDAATPNDGLAAVTAGLSAALPLDIAVLGMGADMHTASLFPGAGTLARALAPDAPAALAIHPPGDLEPRITLTAPTLNKAERHFLIAGAEKRAALDDARTIGDPMKAPLLAVLEGSTVHYAD